MTLEGGGASAFKGELPEAVELFGGRLIKVIEPIFSPSMQLHPVQNSKRNASGKLQ